MSHRVTPFWHSNSTMRSEEGGARMSAVKVFVTPDATKGIKALFTAHLSALSQPTLLTGQPFHSWWWEGDNWHKELDMNIGLRKRNRQFWYWTSLLITCMQMSLQKFPTADKITPENPQCWGLPVGWAPGKNKYTFTGTLGQLDLPICKFANLLQITRTAFLRVQSLPMNSLAPEPTSMQELK